MHTWTFQKETVRKVTKYVNGYCKSCHVFADLILSIPYDYNSAFMIFTIDLVKQADIEVPCQRGQGWPVTLNTPRCWQVPGNWAVCQTFAYI